MRFPVSSLQSELEDNKAPRRTREKTSGTQGTGTFERGSV